MTAIAQLVASARGRIEELDPEGYAAEAARPDTVVVDVREADERLDGIITGAVHVPRGILEFRADPASPYHDECLHPGAASCCTAPAVDGRHSPRRRCAASGTAMWLTSQAASRRGARPACRL